MSLRSALLYPFRGRNVWMFFSLTFGYFLINFVLLSTGVGEWGIAILSILMTAYCWTSLRQLALGFQSLPNIVEAFLSVSTAIVLTVAQLIYGFPLVLLGIWFSHLAAPLNWILFGVLAVFFYLYYAVATIRYLAEEEWTALYDVFNNIRILLLENTGKTWKLLLRFLFVALFISCLTLLLVNATAIFEPYLYADYSNESFNLLLISLCLGFVYTLIELYTILVTTYLWYIFGTELAYFPLRSHVYRNPKRISVAGWNQRQKLDYGGRDELLNSQ